MLPIRGVYEVAIRVKDLAKAEPFYLDVLDLEVGIRDEKRNWLFLKAGGDAGMVVLQEDKGEWPLQHFAFTIDEADIERAATMLRERGVEVEGPVFHQWMNSTSLYFDDPDGNKLELLAVNSSLSNAGDGAAR
jgi:lactoylglutathione lyase